MAEAAWLEPPVCPTRDLYRSLRSSSGSLMRALMELEIRQSELEGRVLDVGGGRAASYASLLRAAPSAVTSVNIDPDMRPTVVTDLDRPLPFAASSFDTVISYNTLEHLADDQLALDEMVRVLRPGGRLHLLVPFLYRVHGHPQDFHRHTAQGWNLMLRRAGIPDDLQRIRPLVWDPFATAWALADVAPLGRVWWRGRRLLRRLVLARPLWMEPVDRRLRDQGAQITSEYALAYAISANRAPDVRAGEEDGAPTRG